MTPDQRLSPAPLRISELHCVLGEHHVVKGISLNIEGGEFFSLLGPSGCGKTTTLRMIAGLEQATSGQIYVDDAEIQETPAYRRPVHTVFQNYALFPHLSVFENVAFGLKERREPKERIVEKVTRILELVELRGKEDLRPRQLSGGMQQRVALARSLVLGPRVLLLDEPLGALDLRMRQQMQLLLKQVQHEVGITFVYVTHDQEEAFAMSDRVAVMEAGILVQVGTPAEVYRRPETRFVAGFVGTSNSLEIRPAGLSNGQFDVILEGIGSGRVSGADTSSLDDHATVIIRPEDITFEDRPGCQFMAEGVVTDVAFLGARTIVRASVVGAGTMTVDVASWRVPPSIVEGAPCRLHWSADDMWVVTG